MDKRYVDWIDGCAAGQIDGGLGGGGEEWRMCRYLDV